MHRLYRPGMLLTVAVLTGCAGVKPTPETQTISAGGIDIVSASPERQLIAFQTPDDREKFCLAPSPDAVETDDESLAFNLPGGQGVSGGEGTSDGNLGGRGQAALITRELLYRTCEFSLNYRLDPNTAEALYRDTLKVISGFTITTPSASNSGGYPSDDWPDDDSGSAAGGSPIPPDMRGKVIGPDGPMND